MNKNPQIIGTAAQIVVPDVVKTVEYYINVLGFELVAYFFEQPPVYGIVQRNGYQVHFGKSDDGTIHRNDTIRKGMPDFIFWVPEIEAFYDEVTRNGAIIMQEIIRRSYGREFIIEDCDGHLVHICD
ncbi:VOC family protein [Mucilaginibacter celer]|uniref:VOC domain-containing protein n=1 Tax=Mucilaginibacter celer TaxID=2305508 RepID=A0A494VGV9_9SPHI|nr:VOC family protein [Mucilaginibacter celer]AYL93837.1 hypothetical protein HYN43_000340 [Mucilaginibacter celer]